MWNPFFLNHYFHNFVPESYVNETLYWITGSFSRDDSCYPEFLSTHPNPENRIEKIMETWQALGGKVGQKYVEEYL